MYWLVFYQIWKLLKNEGFVFCLSVYFPLLSKKYYFNMQLTPDPGNFFFIFLSKTISKHNLSRYIYISQVDYFSWELVLGEIIMKIVARGCNNTETVFEYVRFY